MLDKFTECTQGVARISRLNKQEWTDGFTDEEGRFGGIYLPEQSGILVPPDVFIEKREARTLNVSVLNEQGDRNLSEVECIVYPVPEQWKPPLCTKTYDDYDFKNAGWKEINDTTGLLEDFMRLAPIAYLGKRTALEIAQFAKRWGPLWRCSTHYFEKHWWTPYSHQSDCTWHPSEPVEIWHQWIGEVRGVLDVARCLKQEGLASKEMWEEAFGPGAARGTYESNLAKQKSYLTYYLNSKLTWPGSVGQYSILFSWRDNNRPSLELCVAEFGFMRVLWLQIAQAISGASGIYICNGCQRPYIRKRALAASDKKNFCKECGKKAAKREWARAKATEKR